MFDKIAFEFIFLIFSPSLVLPNKKIVSLYAGIQTEKLYPYHTNTLHNFILPFI